MNIKLKYTLYFILLTLIPIAIGLPFIFIFKRNDILEIIIVVWGLLELLALNLRHNVNNRKLYKKKMTKEEFKISEEYPTYVRIGNLILISGLFNLLVSVIYFYIFVV